MPVPNPQLVPIAFNKIKKRADGAYPPAATLPTPAFSTTASITGSGGEEGRVDGEEEGGPSGKRGGRRASSTATASSKGKGGRRMQRRRGREDAGGEEYVRERETRPGVGQGIRVGIGAGTRLFRLSSGNGFLKTNTFSLL